jgi:TonB family protein
MRSAPPIGFIPWLGIAFRRLAIEAERACDDALLASSDAAAYADQLVALARRLAPTRSPLLAIANRSDLVTRVHAVLDNHQRRGPAGRLAVALACAAAALLVFAESPLTVVAAPQPQTTEARRTDLPRFIADSMLVVVPVSVTDNGRPVSGLTAGALTVTEDDADETVSIFESEQGSYVLGYYTRNDSAYGAFRKIGVTCKRLPMVKLDYRAGYYSIQRTVVPTSSAVEPGVTSPIVLRKMKPEYSDEARKAKYQGTAVLHVEVDATGRVGSVRVARSLGLGLDEKAIEAVKQWRFKPGTRNTQPVAMDAEVEMHFHLL